MPQQKVNPAMGVDQFNQFYSKFNNNADVSINSMAQTGNVVEFYVLSGATFGTINLPLSPNVILSGLVASSIGFALSTTAGTYQVANVQYSIGAGGFTITAAHPTLNRIDVLVVNNSAPAPTGTYQYITGTPAVNAVAPTIDLNQLAVTYINVPAAGVPVINNSPCCIPDGVTTGQTIRWDNTASAWQISNDILSTVNQLTLQAANIVSLSTTGVQKGYFYADDFNSKIGVEVSAGNFEEVLVTQFGVEFTPSGVIESHFNMALLGGIAISDNTPAVTTNRLYNVGGSLWFNGNELCIAPCGGGGTVVNPGTLDFSTLRWDNTALEWVENKQNLANGSKWNQTCCGVIAPSFGVANIATGLLFSQGTGITINGRASVVLSCGQNIQITHIPTSSSDGMNSVIGSHTVDINLHADYKGLCTIIGSTNGGIYHVTAPTTGVGQCLIFGSENMTINGELAYSGIINANDAVLTDVFASSVAWSNVSILGTASANITNTSGILFSASGTINATHAITNRCVIIGSDTATIESGQTCGIYSSVGSQIKAYTGVGAIKCINSAILGGNTNTIDPTGTANIQQCIVIGGVSNNLTGGAGNATNSAIISSTSSDITPAGAGNRIVLIGVDSVSGTRNATTYIDSLKTEGARIKKVHNLGASTYTVLDDDHIIDCQSVGLYTPVTVTLPLTPEDGREVIITNSDGSCGLGTTVTFNGNGKNVNGAATQAINNSPYFYKVLIFVSVTNQWVMS